MNKIKYWPWGFATKDPSDVHGLPLTFWPRTHEVHKNVGKISILKNSLLKSILFIVHETNSNWQKWIVNDWDIAIKNMPESYKVELVISLSMTWFMVI